MIVLDVFNKYKAMVPFPWTVAKIKRAGQDPINFLIEFGRELNICDDAETPETIKLIETLHYLGIL